MEIYFKLLINSAIQDENAERERDGYSSSPPYDKTEQRDLTLL